MKKNCKKTKGKRLENWGAFTADGMIHVGDFGRSQMKIITKGHDDYKPSWSKTGNMLVFFRKIKNAISPANWITTICTVQSDGTEFCEHTGGNLSNYNPTWSRDGKNNIIFSRKKSVGVGCQVWQTSMNSKPGEEYMISSSQYCHHCYAYSCLVDGRIFVSGTISPKHHQPFYYLMTPGRDGVAKFEFISCKIGESGLLDRISVSPCEKMICFEYQKDYNAKNYSTYKYEGRRIYIADFNSKKLEITNPRVIANQEDHKTALFGYPRWKQNGKGVFYHSNIALINEGRKSTESSNAIFLFSLETGKTEQLSSYKYVNFMFPNGYKSPK